MTRSLGLALVTMLFAVSTAGCAIVHSPVGNGVFYTQVSGPVAPGLATGSNKKGRACAASYVGVVAVGNASLEAAKRNGGITEISTVDHESFSVLGFYGRFCTIVSGL